MNTRQNGFLAALATEISAILNKPAKLIGPLGVPLFIFLLYASIFGDGVLRKLPLAIQDNDKSAVSRDLIRQFNAHPTLHFSHAIQSDEEGQRLLSTGKIFGNIVIPENFEHDLMVGKPAQVVLYLNNNYLTPAGLIYKAFNSTVGNFSASARVNVLMKSGTSMLQASEGVQPLVVDSHTLFNPYINYAYYLCLSLFPMVLQMIVMMVSLYTLGSMLKYKQGKAWYTKSGSNVWNAFWAKMLPYTFLFSLVAFFMMAYLYGYLKIPVKVSLIEIYILSLVLIVVYQLIAVFFVTITKDFRSLLSFGGGYSAISFSFSGYTFPQQGMPGGIQVLDTIFPFVSYANLLVNTGIKGLPISSSYPYLLGLGLFALIGLLSLKKYGQMLQLGHYEH